MFCDTADPLQQLTAATAQRSTADPFAGASTLADNDMDEKVAMASCGGTTIGFGLGPLSTVATSDGDEPRRVADAGFDASTASSSPSCSSLATVDCRLEAKQLWDKFHELGTEMIITKSGRLADQLASFRRSNLYLALCVFTSTLALTASSMELFIHSFFLHPSFP
jgi:T-box